MCIWGWTESEKHWTREWYHLPKIENGAFSCTTKNEKSLMCLTSQKIKMNVWPRQKRMLATQSFTLQLNQSRNRRKNKHQGFFIFSLFLSLTPESLVNLRQFRFCHSSVHVWVRTVRMFTFQNKLAKQKFMSIIDNGRYSVERRRWWLR